MDNTEKVYEATRASGVDPKNPGAWNQELLSQAVHLGNQGVTLTFRPHNDEADILSVVARSDVDISEYDGEEVVVLSDTHEVDPGADDPLWFVQAPDGVVFAAWKSELGL